MPSAYRLLGSHYPIDIADELKDEAALLSYLGISDRELKKIWFYRHKMYHAFSISKRRGKVRQINAPDQRLRIIQRKLAPLFDRMYRRRTQVHGFVEERSVKTNAEAHGSRRHVVNLDLKDFFPTITEGRVKGLLSVLGGDGRVVEILARLTCANGHLPQGAPTNPVLSNMICYRDWILN